MCVKEECRTVNSATAPHCEACGGDKPNLKGWLCVECDTRNHQGVKKCRKCNAATECAKGYWMCAACEKNNRVDDLDDNSRCGFCGYDMAPMSMTEAEALRVANERSERLREAQQQFDVVSAREADEQFGDETAGASSLSDEIRQPLPVGDPAAFRGLRIPEVKPFEPAPQATSHSRIGRKKRTSPPVGTPPGPPGFDWMCREASCGTVNPGDEELCSQCGTHIVPAEWECGQCGAMNHLSRARCFNCRVSIPVSWMCLACRAATSIYDRRCRQCEAERPPTEPKAVRDVQAGLTAPGARRAGGGFAGRGQDWNCPECHGLNFASRTACFQCGAARGTAAAVATEEGSGGADTAVSHNNWFCRFCQASNFRTRNSCWQCGRASAESGTTAWSEDEAAPHFEREGFQPDTSGEAADGQVNVWSKKSDDWTCGKCFSKNFKNRQECHKCGAKKTVAVAPRRAFVRKPVKI